MEEERIDIWDESGRPTGKTALKSEAHAKGWWHPTVHIWCYQAGGKVLIEQRSQEKELFPGLWDVSVAGHVEAGEAPEEAALRELREEIGLKASKAELQDIGTFPEQHHHPDGQIDREFHHCFLLKLSHPLPVLYPNAGEVMGLKWISLLQFAEETWGLAKASLYVPHESRYYARIIRELKSRS